MSQPTTPISREGALAESLGLDLWRLAHELYKYKWLVIGAVVAASAITYFWTLRQPRIYEADCTIAYEPSPPRTLGREIDDITAPMQYWSAREYYATQNEIIRSRAVAEKAVRKLGLQHFGSAPEAGGSGAGANLTNAALRVKQQLSVAQDRDTRIVHVRIRDRNAERAMTLANAVADAYIEKTTEDRLGSTTNALEWLGGQLDSLRKDLERSELSLHDFVKEEANLSMPFEEQQSLISEEIHSYNKELNTAHVTRLGLEARLEELEKIDPSDPATLDGRVLAASPTLNSARERFLDRSNERARLTTRYGDQHPQIRELDVDLTRLSAQIRGEVDGMLAGARSQLREAKRIEGGIRALLDQANRTGLDLNLKEITHRRLQRERDNSARLYGAILERTAETDLAHALQVTLVRVVDRALVPTFSVYPVMRTNLTIGAVIGLLAGIGLALLLSQLDKTIRSIEDAEQLGITILGIMPKIETGVVLGGSYYSRKRSREAAAIVENPDLVVHTHPKSSVAECCRTIRTNLTFMAADHPQRALVVTSPNPREGKTTVTLSLAISLTQSGKRVIVVDTDLRRPRVHKALSRTNAVGVTSVLVGAQSVREAIQSTDVPGLDILASGPIPPNPSELLHTAQFGDLIRELTRMYDHVLFDSPPLTVVTDAAVLAPQVDGTILVVHAQKTTHDAVRSALRQLQDVSAHVTGGVMNDIDLSAKRYGYRYGPGTYYYNYGAYYVTEDGKRKPEAPAAEA
jgi:capsular exopolysaccharide synthesis family protein